MRSGARTCQPPLEQRRNNLLGMLGQRTGPDHAFQTSDRPDPRRTGQVCCRGLPGGSARSRGWFHARPARVRWWWFRGSLRSHLNQPLGRPREPARRVSGGLSFKRAGSRWGEPPEPAILRRIFAISAKTPLFVELAGIEPASSSVEPGLLRVQSVLSLFSASELARTRPRQAQSGKSPDQPSRRRLISKSPR